MDIRTRTEIEEQAAAVKTLMAQFPDFSTWNTHPDVVLDELRAEWRKAVAHSCEDFDGECYVEGVTEDGQETFQCQYAAPKAAAKIVHETVEQVMAAPVKVSVDEIPASKYALVEGDHLRFYEVQIGKGKWQGYRFVKLLVGAPGDWDRMPMIVKAQKDVLARIVADTYQDGLVTLTGPMAAAVRFSREHVVCAACMSPLSDEDSVARGLGPVCAKKFAA